MISVLCPTRHRPDNVRRLVTSATATAVGQPQFVFYLDSDDILSPWVLDDLAADYDIAARVAPRFQVPMSDMWNRCTELAAHDLLMFVDDEAVFHTPGWDQRVADTIAGYPDRAVLVHADDTIHGDVLAAYFFVHRTWVDIFGHLTPRQFTYGYADVWCSEVAAAAGRKVYLPDVVIENMAPKDQPPDRVHEENQERAVRDSPGDLYRATQADREQDVRRLLAYIDRFGQAAS
jgi:hypothetical protein